MTATHDTQAFIDSVRVRLRVQLVSRDFVIQWGVLPFHSFQYHGVTLYSLNHLTECVVAEIESMTHEQPFALFFANHRN